MFGEAQEITSTQPAQSEIKITQSQQDTSKLVEKTEPKTPPPEIKIETKTEPKLVKQEISQKKDEGSDPFAGIATKDIEKYSKLFDIPPPENDKEAVELATKIKKWVSQGRPKAGEEQVEEKQTLQEDTKPKKKRSLFGWGSK